MSDCIFCKIIAKEIPATVVYEDDDVLVFMDIGPIIKGHALVISKKHYDPITETPDEIVTRLYLTAKQVAKAQMNFGQKHDRYCTVTVSLYRLNQSPFCSFLVIK